MVTVENLHYQYSGNKEETIKGISFEINSGEIFGFLGPSGAGKSTTQKILTGMLRDYKGKAEILGTSVLQWDRRLYEHIGISFEFPNLFLKLTASENLNFFASLYSGPVSRSEELLTRVGLEKEADMRVEKFSKGMKMRLNFIRSLLHQPKILFLDEPTSGLDPANARNVKNIILKEREKGKTVCITTHNMTVAEELCDRVAFIAYGNLPLIDTPRNMMVARSRKTVRVEWEEKDALLQEEFPLENLGGNKHFLTLIAEKPVQTIHSQEANLEDIFIEVTGARLA